MVCIKRKCSSKKRKGIDKLLLLKVLGEHLMRVAIRVDSSTAIGSGHLMRCLTLANRMRKEKNAEVHFITRDLAGNLHDKIKTAGFFLHVLPRYPLNENLLGYEAWLTVPSAVDTSETIMVLRKLGKIDWLVVDNYALDIKWERVLRPFTNEIFVIDDLANREHDCDVLLDQNFYLDKESRYFGLVPGNCNLLLGPQHALLREEFYEAWKHMRKRDGQIRKILVFYGGSDMTNETIKALNALCSWRRTHPDIMVDVVVGVSNPHKEEIAAFCSLPMATSWMRFHCQVNNMAEFMARADLALGAGGSTTWERCFLELPSIVTSVAENQKKIAEDCAVAGYITYLGCSETVTEGQIVSALDAMTEERLGEQMERMRDMFGDGETAYGALFA